ncbi:EamA family transporter [Iamia sp. SCSIO 61187]|uniref:EamA family transporter n=1 Tax=Iamia sp. SCSIO 61187 TaxID=2722752 RepID=UPI001C628639|nr:EamA family transporter [Iamia sp. SCSIO 61187]QYG91917.1 EamA family transporter [Iamia sp. SCSIO 61187]
MKTSAASPGPALATVLAPISWGTTYVTITELLPDGRPLFVAWMRVAPAGLVLVTLGLLASRWRPRGAEWGRTAVLATCNFGLFFPLLFVAVYRLPGGVAAAVGGLQPLLVLALTGAITGRRPRPRDLGVGVVAAVGVGLVVVRPGADIDPVGVLAAVGANLSFSLGVVLTKRFPAPGNRLAATGWQLLAGAALLTPLALLVEGAPPPITGQNVLGFAYLSLIGTAVAYVLWFRGIRRLPAAAPPLLGLAAPVTGAVMGWVVLGQALSPVQLVGFAVTVGAIAYGATLGGPAPAAVPAPAAPAAVPAVVTPVPPAPRRVACPA